MAGTGGKREGAGRKGLSDEIKGFTLAQPHVERAFKTIADIMIDDTKRPTDRIAAAKILIEYGCGKPKETIEQTHNINDVNIKDLLNFGKSK